RARDRRQSGLYRPCRRRADGPRRQDLAGSLELQRRHRHQCAADQLFGQRQAVHRRARRLAAVPVRHRLVARAEEHFDRVDALRIRAVSAHDNTTFAGATTALRRRFARTTTFLALTAAAVFALCATAPARAQATLSPEEARTLEFGKEIYKVKANCQFCHKWDASGDTGYGGIALSLRKTKLTPEQVTEVVKCGRPLTGMPYHDRLSYTDKRCYGMTLEELGKDAPPMGEFLAS